MKDYSELKMLAEAATPGPWAYDGSYVCPARTEDGTTYVELWRSIADCHQPENTKFIAAANPAAVLALIAEVEGLRAQHGRDSAELRSLCQARDDARKERDQLKAEVERLNEEYDKAWRHDLNDKNNFQVLAADVISLSKDAARYRSIKKDAISDGSLIERLDCSVRPSEWDSYIDLVSVK